MSLPLCVLLGCSATEGSGDSGRADEALHAPAPTAQEEPAAPAGVQAGDTDVSVAANEPLPVDEEGCPGIFAQDLLPTFELEIDPATMATLYEDWVRGFERNALDQDDTPYRHLSELRYGDVVINDASIRLRGNPRFWLEQNKMQFQIAFDRHDPEGRFLGQRKLLFDAATFNRHFFRDRLSLYFMRKVGLPAPCANNARLIINGEYYGLYTSIEKIDDVYLSRVFPGNDTGDLWKRSRFELKTNLDTATDERLTALYDAAENGDLATMEQLLDVEQMLRVAAAEAILPNSDGFWAGGLNFYLYDHPGIGKFIVLPWDLDNTFLRLEENEDPFTFKKTVRFHGRPMYDTALADDGWFDVYVDIIEEYVNAGYDHQELWALIGTDTEVNIGNPSEQELNSLGEWTKQIREAALEDFNKPYTNARMEDRRSAVAGFIRNREVFLRDTWLACWRAGGVRDSDGNCVPGAQ